MTDTKQLAGGERTDAPGDPSGYRVEQAFSAWQSARARLLIEDPSLEQDEEALRELLGPEEGEINDIIARVLRAKVHAENMAKAADEQAALIVARKRRYQVREDNMRALAFAMMDTLGRRKVELGDMTASIVKGRIGVHIADVAEVPDIYVEIITERKPDRAVIKSVIEAGHDVPGAELRNGMDYLMIKKG